MCNYHTLYSSDQLGHVIQCLRCDHIQFAFGNVTMTFCRRDFYQFQKWIQELSAEHRTSVNPSLRNVAVLAPCQGMKLVFSPYELTQLSRILDTAEIELMSQEMISLFGDHY